MAQNPPVQTPPADGTDAQAQPGVLIDPYRAYNFKLVIQGVTAGHFTECSGLGIEVDAIAYREAGNQQVVHRVPGRVRYDDITLSYGVTSSRELFDWVMSAVNGSPSRKNVSILLLDSSGVTEVMRYDLINAWPSRWRGAEMNALNHELAIENITLVFETLQRA